MSVIIKYLEIKNFISFYLTDTEKEIQVQRVNPDSCVKNF